MGELCASTTADAHGIKNTPPLQEAGNLKALADKSVEYCTWYLSLNESRFLMAAREFEYQWAILDAEVKIMKKYNSPQAEVYEQKVDELYNMYVDRIKQ